jgi:hypothetical protein
VCTTHSYHVNENLERVPPIGNILSVLLGILKLKRLDADEKLQCFQLPYIPCSMVSGNEIKLCLKYFCLLIYFIHFEISLTFISPKPSPKPSDVQLLSTVT